MTKLQQIFAILHKELGFEIAHTVFCVLEEFKITEDFVHNYGTLANDTLKKIKNRE